MRAFACLATLAVTASCAAISKRNDRASYATKEDFYAPRGWTRVADADPEHVINLSFGLKQSNFPELERHLYEVSDPDHSRYGQHLTADEVDKLVAPTDDTNSLVHDWLMQYGINTERMSYSAAKDWIHVSMPVREVEALLDTKYSLFEHADGTHLVRTLSYAMPSHLHEHVDTIAPTTSFNRGRPQVKISQRSTDSMPKMAENGLSIKKFFPDQQAASSPSGTAIEKACNFNAVTPDCLRTLYGTIDYNAKVPFLNKVGIANYLNETQNITDLAFFLRKYRPEAVPGAYFLKFDIIDNGDNQQTQLSPAQLAAGQDLEGNLDGDYVLGIGYPTPVTSFNTGGMQPGYMPDLLTPTNTNEPYLAWVNYVLALPSFELPQVITTSYGDDEQTVSESYANRVCQQYARLGARGVTLLFSSGDSGVGPNGQCFSNKPGQTNKNMFLPSFSASCPYVTTVGGTKNYPEVVAFDPRNGYAPGGGFSNYFARPSYQDAVVTAYIKSLNGLYDGLYNKSGRAYPDISAQGQSFVVGWNGTFVLLDGTSASSPTAAGVLTLVNDALLSHGKPVLGFLNPALYKNLYKSFTDVTVGSAIGCNRAGFPAQAGWDAASGWGTPNFPKIVSQLGADKYF